MTMLWRTLIDITYCILILRPVNTINWKPKALKQMRRISAQAGAAIRKSVNAELIDLSAARNV